MTAAEKAARLRDLHRAGRPLIAFNAYDAVSARILESLGAPAIATSSGGICFVQGYRDGGRIPRETMLAAVQRIASSVEVPVSADMEGGYGDDVAAARETARGLIWTGAVGLNFEDRSVNGAKLIDAELQAARIRAIRDAGAELGVPLVINARTDAFFGDYVAPGEEMRETLRRAKLYREAGADCIFVPGEFDDAQITQLVEQSGAPLNILALPDNPDAAQLAKLGVARISYGTAPIKLALTHFRNAARAALDGSFSFEPDTLTYAEVNELFP